jgi:hypothetical protein
LALAGNCHERGNTEEQPPWAISSSTESSARSSLMAPKDHFHRHDHHHHYPIHSYNKKGPSKSHSQSDTKDPVTPTVVVPSVKRLSTRDLRKEEEKMSRTKDVKDRLGPIVDRLTASLDKISTLEERLELRYRQTGGETSTNLGGDSLSSSSHPSLSRPDQSRALMQKSMVMVKKKLLMLKNMEEKLAEADERRHQLQHHFLQASLSTSGLELATTKRENAQLQDRIQKLEQELSVLAKKCLLVNDLELRNVALVGKASQCDLLEHDLKEAIEERERIRHDLIQRQAKIREQAIKCDNLECQVEYLKNLCDELMANVKEQEDRNASLEQELLDTRKFAHVPHRDQPRTIVLQESKGSTSNESTSLTESSYEEEEEESSDDNGSSSSGDVFGPFSTATLVLPTKLNANQSKGTGPFAFGHPSNSELVACESIGSDALLVQTLMAKIEDLERENASLRESKYNAMGKCKALGFEVDRQAALIQSLQGEMVAKVTPCDSATVPESKVCISLSGGNAYRGRHRRSFFQKAPASSR